MWLIWTIFGIFAAAFIVHSAFLALCTAKRLVAAEAITPFMSLVAAFWLVVGWPCDVIFNWTAGAWWFKEWRGLTFSSHIQSRVDRGLWDYRTAMWAKELNVGDPTHIKRTPG